MIITNWHCTISQTNFQIYFGSSYQMEVAKDFVFCCDLFLSKTFYSICIYICIYTHTHVTLSVKTQLNSFFVICYFLHKINTTSYGKEDSVKMLPLYL